MGSAQNLNTNQNVMTSSFGQRKENSSTNFTGGAAQASFNQTFGQKEHF